LSLAECTSHERRLAGGNCLQEDHPLACGSARWQTARLIPVLFLGEVEIHHRLTLLLIRCLLFRFAVSAHDQHAHDDEADHERFTDDDYPEHSEVNIAVGGYKVNASPVQVNQWECTRSRMPRFNGWALL